MQSCQLRLILLNLRQHRRQLAVAQSPGAVNARQHLLHGAAIVVTVNEREERPTVDGQWEEHVRL